MTDSRFACSPVINKTKGVEELNKTSIKIIKRKDAEAAVKVKIQDANEIKPTAEFSEEKVERRLHRKLADTVSNWIADRKENNRTNEISAIRKLFGDESLLSKTA